MEEILNFFRKINFFDVIIILILIYSVIQCGIKGFSLSIISFMKWVLSTVITILLVPKLQPIVGEYIQSQFINNIGLGVMIFILTLFLTIVVGKALGRAFTWTGLGSIDKSWNYLVEKDSNSIVTKSSIINMAHWTLGGPWFKDQRLYGGDLAAEWFAARDISTKLWD